MGVTTNSPALTVALGLIEQCQMQQPDALQLQREACTLRRIYDQRNEELEDGSLYPDQDVLLEEHKQWSQTIDELLKREEGISKLASKIRSDLIQIQMVSFSVQDLTNMEFLNPEAAKAIRDSYARLQAREGQIRDQLEKIQSVSKKALEEIRLIMDHPHARHAQVIDNVRSGMTRSTFSSRVTGRVSRNISAAVGRVWS